MVGASDSRALGHEQSHESPRSGLQHARGQACWPAGLQPGWVLAWAGGGGLQP